MPNHKGSSRTVPDPIGGGAQVREDFDYDGDMLRFKKKVTPGDVLLNFSGLLKALQNSGYSVYDPDEAEVWFAATPYYTQFTQKEFVDGELADGTELSSDPQNRP